MSFQAGRSGDSFRQQQARRSGSNIRIEERSIPDSRSSNADNYNSSYDDDDDSENEEERILSELHGEAADSSRGNRNASTTMDANGKKRKSTTDKDNIEDQYRQLSAKRNKVPRPKITVETLTGVDGLIRIPTEFTRSIRSVVPKSRKDIAGAAAFSRALMRSYERFANDLFPSACAEDVYYKVEQLGSNKVCRDYIQQMRMQQRNAHLEKVFGKEKATKIIDEFDDEIRQQELSTIQNLEENNGATAESSNTENVAANNASPSPTTTNDDNLGSITNRLPAAVLQDTPSRMIATNHAMESGEANNDHLASPSFAVTPNGDNGNKNNGQHFGSSRTTIGAVDHGDDNDSEEEIVFQDEDDDESGDQSDEPNRSNVTEKMSKEDAEIDSDDDMEIDETNDISEHHAPKLNVSHNHRRRIVADDSDDDVESDVVVDDEIPLSEEKGDYDKSSMQDTTEQSSDMECNEKQADGNGEQREELTETPYENSLSLLAMPTTKVPTLTSQEEEVISAIGAATGIPLETVVVNSAVPAHGECDHPPLLVDTRTNNVDILQPCTISRNDAYDHITERSESTPISEPTRELEALAEDPSSCEDETLVVDASTTKNSSADSLSDSKKLCNQDLASLSPNDSADTYLTVKASETTSEVRLDDSSTQHDDPMDLAQTQGSLLTGSQGSLVEVSQELDVTMQQSASEKMQGSVQTLMMNESDAPAEVFPTTQEASLAIEDIVCNNSSSLVLTSNESIRCDMTSSLAQAINGSNETIKSSSTEPTFSHDESSQEVAALCPSQLAAVSWTQNRQD